MMAPLPNCFSMDPTTLLMVRSFSAMSTLMVLSVLVCAPPGRRADRSFERRDARRPGLRAAEIFEPRSGALCRPEHGARVPVEQARVHRLRDVNGAHALAPVQVR